MTDSFDAYLQRVRKVKRPTVEVERKWVQQMQAGDNRAMHRLVESHLGYVVAMSIGYRRYGIPLPDLVAEGNLGLMIAARKFDPDKGTRFSTYAAFWIRAFILDAVVQSQSSVSAGAGVLRSKIFFRLRRERAKLASVVPDAHEQRKELAKSFGVSPEAMHQMLARLDARDLSLETPLGGESQTTFLDTLEAKETSVQDTILSEEYSTTLGKCMSSALKVLTERERYVVEQRYYTEKAFSLAAIGRRLGISRERARQIEAKAKSKLLEHLNQHCNELRAA